RGGGGGGPGQVNRAETEGSGWIWQTYNILHTDPPVKVAEGPFIVTNFVSQQGGQLFVAPGPTCPMSGQTIYSNGNASNGVPGPDFRRPVQPGQVLCAAWGQYSDPPNSEAQVMVMGYRSY